MGWTYVRNTQNLDVATFMRRELEQPFIAGQQNGWSIEDHALTREAYFAIVKRTLKDPPHHHDFIVIVCLIDRGAGQIGYKDMDESMGPFVVPPQAFFKRIEKLIPDPPQPFGAAWRDRCRAQYAAARQTA